MANRLTLLNEYLHELPPAWGIPSKGVDTNAELEQKITYMKIAQVVSIILGYIPYICIPTGALRMLVGAYNCYFISRSELSMEIKESLIKESQRHIIRGTLEAFVPFGKMINLVLDIRASALLLTSDETPQIE